MPFDSSIYWKHAAAMPQQSDLATGLSGLSRVVKQRAAMDEYDEVQAYKRSQDAQQNQRRDDLLRIQQQQEARQQDTVNDRRIAQSIASNVGVTPNQSVQSRAMQMLPYDSSMATGLAKLGELYKPEETEYTIKQNNEGGYIYMPKKPGDSIDSGVMGKPPTNSKLAPYPQWLEDTGNTKSPDSYKKYIDQQKTLKSAETSGLSENQRITQETKLRKEFTTASSDFKKVRNAHTRILQSAKDPSPAGDLALIFNYMKVLDPGSVVRESEFRTAESAKSALENAKESGEKIPNFIWGTVNKMLTGQRMLETQRADFVNRANMLYTGMEQQYNKRVNSYGKLADAYGFDRNNIIMDMMPTGVGEMIPSKKTNTDGIKFLGFE